MISSLYNFTTMTNFESHYNILQYFNGINLIGVVHTTTV